MASIIDIEDDKGELVERLYYCSDYHAQQNKNYAGFNGVHELHSNEYCDFCSKGLTWFDSDEQAWKVGLERIDGKHSGYYSLLGTYLCYSCGAYCEDESEEEE